MKPTIIKPASRDEWLKAREDGIGASEVAAILGLSPWETPFSLYLRKTKQVPPLEENVAMRLGHLLEPVVVTLWEEETSGRAVKASAKDIIYQDARKPWRKCTPDRIAYMKNPETGKREKMLLEIKPSSMEFDPDDLPVYYVAQCQYQMLITGMHKCELCWLTNGRYFGHAPVEWDETFANFIGEQVDTFWNESVLGGKEPELISVSDFVMKGSDPGTTIEADDEAVANLLSLVKTNAEKSAVETDAEALKDSLKLYMGEAESLIYEGKTLATWKSGSRGRTFLLKNKNIDELNQSNEQDADQ